MGLETALAAFFCLEQVTDIKEYGSGHIHETYLITMKNGHDQYILQNLNHSIFKNIPELQRNIVKVTCYINGIIQNSSDQSLEKTRLKVVKTIDNNTFYQDELGNYWRIFNFIQSSRTFDSIKSPHLAQQGGMALGRFLHFLHDFPVNELHVTLPDFHDLDVRHQQFEEALHNDSVQRKVLVEGDIDFVRIHISKLRNRFAFSQNQDIPVRVTHNDPKFNNILFDDDNNSICMIDLDTVMPGYIYYDFGDAIRTGAASASEDEEDVGKMFIQLDLFKAYAKGFLSETQAILTPSEVSILAIAPQLMTFIIGLRFLTDYLNGDIYFKTSKEHHNLQRWQAQKALLLDMEKNENEMRQIINEITLQQSIK